MYFNVYICKKKDNFKKYLLDQVIDLQCEVSRV